jgi:hypothetical protein
MVRSKVRHNGGVTRPPVISYVFGMRPNFVKMAPVLEQLRAQLPAASHIGVHTGQHYDREMSEVFFAELGVPAPDHLLGVGSDTHGAQTARALERLERVMLDEPPDVVIVPGDVNSTLAAALAAAKLGIPVAHIESGLRSFDWTTPEEINRVIVDRLSRWCFTHSPEARQNLVREGIPSDRVFEVGNTMIDSLVRMRPRIERSDVHRRLEIPDSGYFLGSEHIAVLLYGVAAVREGGAGTSRPDEPESRFKQVRAVIGHWSSCRMTEADYPRLARTMRGEHGLYSRQACRSRVRVNRAPTPLWCG